MPNRFQKDLNRLIHHPPGTGRLTGAPAKGAFPAGRGAGKPSGASPSQEDIPVENPTLFFHDRVYSPQAWSCRTWDTLNNFATVDYSGNAQGGQGVQMSFSSVNGKLALLQADLTGNTSATSDIIDVINGASAYSSNGAVVIHSFCRRGKDWYVGLVDDATDPVNKAMTVKHFDENFNELSSFGFTYNGVASPSMPGLQVTNNRIVLWIDDGGATNLQFRDLAGNLISSYSDAGSGSLNQAMIATDRTVVLSIVDSSYNLHLIEFNELGTIVLDKIIATNIAYGYIAPTRKKCYVWTIDGSASPVQVLNVRDRTETKNDAGVVTAVSYSDPTRTLTPQTPLYSNPPMGGWAIDQVVS